MQKLSYCPVLLLDCPLKCLYVMWRVQIARRFAIAMIQILGFANYLDIVGKKHTQTWQIHTLSSLRNEAIKLDLNIKSETKYMKTTDATVQHQEANTVNISGQQFKIVDKFVHLGALIRQTMVPQSKSRGESWLQIGLPKYPLSMSFSSLSPFQKQKSLLWEGQEEHKKDKEGKFLNIGKQ